MRAWRSWTPWPALTVKDDDGNDTFRPTEEAAITINHVTITTYTAEADIGLDTVG